MGSPGQIVIVSERDENEVRLYAHWGAPHNILPEIKRAYKRMMKDPIGTLPGVPEKIGSFLCAVAPGEIVPESTQWAQMDLAHRYVIYPALVTPDESVWEVEIQHVQVDPETHRWGDLAVVVPRTRLDQLQSAYRKYEEQEG